MNKNQPCHSIFLRLGRFARLHRRRFCRALLAGCMVAVSGCGGLGFSAKQAPAHSATQAAAPADEQSPASPATPSAAANRHGDPMEGANRAVLKFNLQVDRLLLKPAARAYRKLPAPARNGTRNFFANLWMPSTIVNNVLQGKFADAGRGLGRFAINSVLGFFGLMDPATEMGLPERREDFGQTLAVWGVPSGPYLMLPFLGPSNLRDAVALAPQNAADPVSALPTPEAEVGTGLRAVQTRAGLLNLDAALALQPDKYLFIREGYRQIRQQQIYDGEAPADAALEDELLDEALLD